MIKYRKILYKENKRMRTIKVAIVDERLADKKVVLVDERCADMLISVVDERCAELKVAIVNNEFYADMKVAIAGDVANRQSEFQKLLAAAKAGNKQAQFDVGLCYDEGKGVRKDSYEAFKWFKEAALQGHAKAQNAVGICYENGEGVVKNLSEAIRWYELAISNGSDKALLSLAGVYADKGGAYNEKKAWELIEKAARLGNQDAKNLIRRFR
jgi:TPR repeat protein